MHEQQNKRFAAASFLEVSIDVQDGALGTVPPKRSFEAGEFSMYSDQISLKLDGRGNRQYFPGETLAGCYYLDDIRTGTITAIEISVLWHTMGKGNEDFGIHAFWRRTNQTGVWVDPRKPGRFSTILPNSPLSYEGIFVKIYWCVRVRVFLEDGRQLVEELPFRLGDIPNVRKIKNEFQDSQNTSKKDDQNASDSVLPDTAPLFP